LQKTQPLKIPADFPVTQMQHVPKNTCFPKYNEKCHNVAFFCFEPPKKSFWKIFFKKTRKISFWEKKGEIGRY
jgi:hypothetical protein